MKNFVKFMFAFVVIVAAGTFFVTQGLGSPNNPPRFLEHFRSGGPLSVGTSGVVSEESRVLADFTRIELSGSGSVRLTVGGDSAVVVKTDKNMLQFVESEVRDGVLHLGVKRGAPFFMTPVSFAVSAKRVESIRTSGSGDVSVETPISGDNVKFVSEGSGKLRAAFQAKKVEAQISGSGDMALSGAVEDLSLSIRGSGNVKASNLSGRKLAADIAGSGSVDMGVFETIDANIAGSGDIVYSGTPRVTSRILGSGKLRAR